MRLQTGCLCELAHRYECIAQALMARSGHSSYTETYVYCASYKLKETAGAEAPRLAIQVNFADSVNTQKQHNII